jgi:hypothetical protein
MKDSLKSSLFNKSVIVNNSCMLGVLLLIQVAHYLAKLGALLLIQVAHYLTKYSTFKFDLFELRKLQIPFILYWLFFSYEVQSRYCKT